MSGQRLEVLVTSEASGQMWNTCVWDPTTGSALKTYKGSVTKPKTSVILGNTFLVSSQPTKPLLNVWQLNRHEQKPLKYTTPGVLQSIAASPCGHFLTGTVEERVYVWQTSSGKLLRIITNGHYQKINAVKFTTDGSSFITVGEDGNVALWDLDDVINRGMEMCKPRCVWSNHSLGVTDFHVGNGGINGRVYTASKDQTAKIYCITSGHFLLDVEFPAPLLSIAVDVAEEGAFVGTTTGLIHSFSLKNPPRDLKMSVDSTPGNTFKGHSAGVTCLSISLDSLTLASGSDDHDVRIWHVKSRQCTRVITHKGAITHLQYMVPKQGMLNPDDFKANVVLSLLEKTATDKKLIDSDVYSVDIISNGELEDMDHDVAGEPGARELLSNNFAPRSEVLHSSNGVDDLSSSSDEVQRLKAINLKLYQEAVKSILNSK
jgi:pre-rRNA-processing protein IPI3